MKRINFNKKGFKKVPTNDGSIVYRIVLDNEEAIQVTIIDSEYFVNVFVDKETMIEGDINGVIDNLSSATEIEVIEFLKFYI